MENYRIMRIGKRYAVQVLIEKDTAYLDRETNDLWFSPEKVVDYCLFDTYDAAKNRAEIYFDGHDVDAKALMATAIEVKS
jgi:hypothetical protein